MASWKNLTLATALVTAGLSGPTAGAMAQEAKPAAQTPEARLDALEARFEQAQQDWMAKVRKAESEDERQRLYAANPSKEFVEPFRALAYEASGTETAAGAWVWVGRLAAQNQRHDEAREALEILVNDHLTSPRLAEVAADLRYGAQGYGRESAEKALRAIREGSPHADAKAAAQFSLAALLMDTGEERAKAEAKDLLVELRDRMSDAGPWKDRAAGMLFELERLQVGMIAPDFETVDQDGAKWKLADYRGKVVILDFWGIW